MMIAITINIGCIKKELMASNEAIPATIDFVNLIANPHAKYLSIN
jgi:hypothetical protein